MSTAHADKARWDTYVRKMAQSNSMFCTLKIGKEEKSSSEQQLELLACNSVLSTVWVPFSLSSQTIENCCLLLKFHKSDYKRAAAASFYLYSSSSISK